MDLLSLLHNVKLLISSFLGQHLQEDYSLNAIEKREEFSFKKKTFLLPQDTS